MNKIVHIRHKRETSKGGGIIKRMFFLFIFLVLSGFTGIFLFFWWITSNLPTMTEIKNVQSAQASIIYDRNGKVLYTVHGKENRKVIPFNEIKNETIYSVIALEDINFFDHKGVDFFGVIRAILGQLHIINYKGGGSTLTQQFVKNKFLTNQRSVIRKIKEMILSAQVENYYSKEEIITMYLNQIPFGSSIYGIEQASKQFFGKSSRDLTLAESAIIASIPNATTYYSPYGSNSRTNLGKGITLDDLEQKGINSYEKLVDEYGKDAIFYGLLPRLINTNSGAITFYLPGRSSYALDILHKLGYINDNKKDQALLELFNYQFKEFREDIKAPHFVMYVKKLIEDKYGENALIEGGLKIITTIDLSLQEKAEEIIKSSAFSNSDGAENQSLLTVDTKSGDILTMVGSRDFFDKDIDGQVNVTIQKRLAGSTFKPIAYTSMLFAGYSPSNMLFDVKTDFGEGSEKYEPKNFDGKFMGPMSIRSALGHSRNIPAIKAGILGGLQKTYDIVKSLGIEPFKNAEWYGASMSLGTIEVTAKELLGAYLVFANNGKKIEMKSIIKVLNKDGIILEQIKYDQDPPVVLDPEISYLITDILSDKSARGPGWNSRLQLKDRVNTAKTGTSNKQVKVKGKKDPVVMPLDGWTIGFTPQYATVVWAGNNDGSPMGEKASGWSTSAKTWYEYMTYLHIGKKPLEFEKPKGIKYFKIVEFSGKLPNKDTPESIIKTGVFGSLNIPKEYDDSVSFVEVDKVTKKLISEYTPESAKTKAAILNFHSEKPDNEKWEKPVQDWIKEYAKDYLKGKGIEDVLVEAPTDYDNIHTKENVVERPSIKIISPKNGGLVSKNGFNVMPEASSKYGIVKIEYYIDGELLDTSYEFPFQGKITFKDNQEIGSKHELSIKVFDDLYNTTVSNISVEVGNDTTPPFLEIVKPNENQEIVAGSSYEIKTLSYDVGGSMDKVVFFLNDKEIGQKKEYPYSMFIKVPDQEQTNTIKTIAYDKTGNESSSKVNFISKIKTESGVENSNIIIGGKIPSNNPYEIQIELPSKEIINIDKVQLIGRYNNIAGEETEVIIGAITNLKGNKNGVFYLTWQSPQKGQYQIYTKEYYKNRKILKSSKFNVLVE